MICKDVDETRPSESLNTDQKSLYDNGKASNVIVTLKIVPDGTDFDSYENITNNTKLSTSICDISFLEINVSV